MSCISRLNFVRDILFSKYFKMIKLLQNNFGSISISIERRQCYLLQKAEIKPPYIYLVHMKNKSMFVSLPSVASCCDRSRSPWQPPWNFIICSLNIFILMQTCDQNLKVVSIPECDIILTADELHHRLKYSAL